ncbi:4-hydroxybenzoate octaprenyltransferase [Rubripirellula obstinata]|uniref:4-hydroxybenzoate polyprenyltransferase n=1 Tax=Rubripirellula obstinata TaxID=406547 RepID=A0A5B1CBZ9_9BACT|nr:4-hydroxybenzoate octaprenyltransferase [Rubripirellula obstinata]KAA1257742.1 4-hydroxybenzoate octaprenyltransferase [Rubripirellula obstinata]
MTQATQLTSWLGLIRFSHTIFALPFAALAAVMALATPIGITDTFPAVRLRDLAGILICMVTARSTAMAFNRLVDRKIDAANPRTASRHIPAGVLSANQVLWFTLFCGIAFIAATALFLPNRIPLIASVPVLLFLCGYSLAKRFTSAAHLWLGVALSLSPIAAWVAIRGGYMGAFPNSSSELIGWLSDLAVPTILAVAVALWVTGFDIIYACQDAAFDADAGLNSVPARFGIAGALRIAAACHVVMLIVLAFLPCVSQPLGWVFWIAIAATTALVIRQHRLVRPDDLDRVNQAFFDTNAIISVTLLVAGVADCVV